MTAGGPSGPLIVANWKMNGSSQLLEATADVLRRFQKAEIRAAVCPPAVLLPALAAALSSTAALPGAQDLHWADGGPHTGDHSATLLADAGARLILVGHSERRAAYGEGCELVRRKARSAMSAGLLPVICVGETQAERDAGRSAAVVADQLAGRLPDGADGPLAVAYEPIWAIGSGRTPSASEIVAVHAAISQVVRRRKLAANAPVPVLYGGSVTPGNAGEILDLPGVDGALVGGASLSPEAFTSILYQAAAVGARRTA